MKALLKPLLVGISLAVIIYVAFRVHMLLGIGVVVLLVGYMLFVSRANFYAIRGSKAFSNNDLGQAKHWYEKAYTSKPCPDQHQIGYGYILIRVGEPEKAETIFKHILGKSQSRDFRMQANSNLATAYWLQGKKDEAIALLEEVFTEYKNTMVYGNLGYFKILHGDLQEALAFNLEAYSYNGDDITILDNMAQNYYLLGQVDQANEMFKKLIPKSPKHADSYYYYALTLKELGELEAAIEQLNVALEKKISFLAPITRDEMEQAASQMQEELKLSLDKT